MKIQSPNKFQKPNQSPQKNLNLKSNESYQ